MPKQIDDSAVFHAVITVLLRYGYAGATTKRLAQAAGVNEVTLFRKYGSKAQLVAAAVTHETQTVANDAVAYSGDLRADLLQIVDFYTSSAQRHGRLFALVMSEMARYPELRATIDVPIATVQQIGALLKRYQQEGVLHNEPTLHAVSALLGPLMVVNMLHNANPDLPLAAIDHGAHVDRFLHGRRS